MVDWNFEANEVDSVLLDFPIEQDEDESVQ